MAKEPTAKPDSGAASAPQTPAAAAAGSLPPSPFVPMPTPRFGGTRPLVRDGVAHARFVFQRPAVEAHVRSVAKQAGDTLAGGLDALAKAAQKVRGVLAAVTDEQKALWAELAGVVALAELEAGASAFEAMVEQFKAGE